MKLSLSENSKIYIHVPAGRATGGIELLHQLASLLRDYGRNSFIVFFGENEYKIHPDYIKYNIQIADEIEDSVNNIEVYSETMADDFISNTRSTQKLFWWLSVDNFISDGGRFNLRTIYKYKREKFLYYLKHRLKMLLKYHKNEITDKVFPSAYANDNTICGYQCEYIKEFLQNNGFKNLYPLYDYINTEHIVDISTLTKEDIVLYNPAKGYEFTKELISLAPDLKWIPLKGYSRQELINVIRKAKLYIDFGNFPGKDRLPRECAINGCCIITGKRGAAAYSKDIPILPEYKFEDKVTDKQLIIKKIRWTLNNYSAAIKDFENYRKIIISEKDEFENQVKEMFSLR